MSEIDLEERTSYIDGIRAVSSDIDSLVNDIKILKEQAEEVVQRSSAWQAVEEAKEVYEKAKYDLKAEMLSKPEYTNIMEKIATKDEELKDNRDILSQQLVNYFGRTGERQVATGETEAREVILKGKLGKEAPYQQSLLTPTSS